MASSLEVCGCSCSVAPWSACCGSVCPGSAAAWVFVCVGLPACLCECACVCVCMGRLLTREGGRGVEKVKEGEFKRRKEGERVVVLERTVRQSTTSRSLLDELSYNFPVQS